MVVNSDKHSLFLTRQLNQVNKLRDAVYLDTNAWSMFAKEEISYEPLLNWIKTNNFHIWLAKFQLAELSSDNRLAKPISKLLKILPVFIYDHGQEELNGNKWYKIYSKVDEYYSGLKKQDKFSEN